MPRRIIYTRYIRYHGPLLRLSLRWRGRTLTSTSLHQFAVNTTCMDTAQRGAEPTYNMAIDVGKQRMDGQEKNKKANKRLKISTLYYTEPRAGVHSGLGFLKTRRL